MAADAAQPSLPPLRRRPSRRGRAMRGVITAVVLLAAVLVAAAVVWRLHRRDMVERAMAHDLQLGMPLAEVTAYLQRLGVEFTTDSTAEGMIVRFGRKVTRGAVSEQQILFDAQQRLLDMRSVAHIMGR
jgi:hypothetical protein